MAYGDEIKIRNNTAQYFIMDILFIVEFFVLVSWPEEGNSVSVVCSSKCVSGTVVVGGVCQVLEKKKTFPARVHATGYTYN